MIPPASRTSASLGARTARRSTARIRAISSSVPNGLGKIIIGPGIETGHAICLGRASREHDHRDLALAPNQPEQLETIEPRHHHVQKQQVVLSAQCPGQSPAPVIHGLEPDIPAGEKFLEELA